VLVVVVEEEEVKITDCECECDCDCDCDRVCDSVKEEELERDLETMKGEEFVKWCESKNNFVC
jgi:hypothetical protein